MLKESNFLYQATAELKQAFKDPAIIPALCAVMTGSQNPQVSYCYLFNSLSFHSPTRRLALMLSFLLQVRQSAAVMLRMRVRKHWKKISPDHRERFWIYFSLISFHLSYFDGRFLICDSHVFILLPQSEGSGAAGFTARNRVSLVVPWYMM